MSDAESPDPQSLQSHLAVAPLTPGDNPSEVRDAIAMHNQTIAAANSFHSLFCEGQKAGKQADNDHEQDLLRAMLLFTCSGLDATVKQLVRDCLKMVIAKDEGAQGQFAKFIERRLKRGQVDELDRQNHSTSNFDYSLLSRALARPEPRAALFDDLIYILTSDSLQSRDQLLKVAGHFAITKDEVLKADNITKQAFEARNQLAHEMDIIFEGGPRRRARTYANMVTWSENILSIGEEFIGRVSLKLRNDTL